MSIEKLSAENVLPDTPPPLKWPCRDIVVALGWGTHNKVLHESKFI